MGCQHGKAAWDARRACLCERLGGVGARAACHLHGGGRLLLHAHSLEITHPSSEQTVRFAAPPPEAFAAEAARLGVPAEALERLRGEASVRWGGERDQDQQTTSG